MGENAIIEELRYIHQLLDESLRKMDEILRPKMGNVLWRVFFPAGQFMQQKSTSKAAAGILINIGTRLQEMIQVLEEKEHPLTQTIQSLVNLDMFMMADKLIELPERAQYFFPQIEDLQKRIEEIIEKIELGRSN